MKICRFLYQNYLTAPQMLAVSSARPGLVGMPAPRALGGAVAHAWGEHTGPWEQLFLVEIDSVSAGEAIGQATFRWRRDGDATWRASGVATSATPLELADGVKLRWSGASEPHFALGDAWSILAVRGQGQGALCDGDRDSAWCSLAAGEQWVQADLGQARRVRAVVLADHNLTAQARLTLLAGAEADLAQPSLSLDLAPGQGLAAAFLDHAAQHWRLELDDPANPEGALSASMLYLGDYFAPSRNHGLGQSQATTAGRRIATTDAGKVAGQALGLGESFSLRFNYLSNADVAGFQEVYRVAHDRQSGRLRPVFFTPDPEQPAQTHYCLLGPSLDRSRHHSRYWTVGLDLEEVVRTHV